MNRIKTVVMVFAAVCVASQTLLADDQNFVREAGAHFQETCRACHVPPDLRFATDRAWLGQILETD